MIQTMLYTKLNQILYSFIKSLNVKKLLIIKILILHNQLYQTPCICFYIKNIAGYFNNIFKDKYPTFFQILFM